MFAAATNEANRPSIVFQVANESSGDAFFRSALGFFFSRADLHDGRAVILDAGIASELRLLVRIDVLDVHLGRELCVLIKDVSRPLKARALVEISDGRVLLQAFHNLHGLIGEAVTFVRRAVIRLVVAVAKYVRDDHDCQHDENVDRRICCVFGLSGFEKLHVELRPPTQRFHGTAGKEQSQENHGYVKDCVFRIDHPFGKRFEMVNDRQI